MAPHAVADSNAPSSEPPSKDPTNTTTITTPPTIPSPPNPEAITAPSGDPPPDGKSLPPSYYQSSANTTAAAVTAGVNPSPPPPTVNASGQPPLPQPSPPFAPLPELPLPELPTPDYPLPELPPPDTGLFTQPLSADAIVDRFMRTCGSLTSLDDIDVSSLGDLSHDAALLGSLKRKLPRTSAKNPFATTPVAPAPAEVSTPQTNNISLERRGNPQFKPQNLMVKIDGTPPVAQTDEVFWDCVCGNRWPLSKNRCSKPCFK